MLFNQSEDVGGFALQAFEVSGVGDFFAVQGGTQGLSPVFLRFCLYFRGLLLEFGFLKLFGIALQFRF